jgi:hypothetical protein
MAVRPGLAPHIALFHPPAASPTALISPALGRRVSGRRVGCCVGGGGRSGRGEDDSSCGRPDPSLAMEVTTASSYKLFFFVRFLHSFSSAFVRLGCKILFFVLQFECTDDRLSDSTFFLYVL